MNWSLWSLCHNVYILSRIYVAPSSKTKKWWFTRSNIFWMSNVTNKLLNFKESICKTSVVHMQWWMYLLLEQFQWEKRRVLFSQMLCKNFWKNVASTVNNAIFNIFLSFEKRWITAQLFQEHHSYLWHTLRYLEMRVALMVSHKTWKIPLFS